MALSEIPQNHGTFAIFQATDSLLNFENVKYYGNDDFEVKGYRKVMEDFQSLEYLSTASFRWVLYPTTLSAVSWVYEQEDT